MSDAARRAMIDSQLRPQGVTEPRLLDAFRTVAREEFLPDTVKAAAYQDRSIPLGKGDYALAPVALARLLGALDIRSGDTVLIAGPGGDYAAALVEHLGGQPTKSSLEKPAKGSFDAVLILGAVEELPQKIVDALDEGGRVATGLVDGVTRLAIGYKTGGSVALDDFADMQMPRLAAAQRKAAFTF